ncbi:MAG TPA: hypothetical protein VJP58_10345 [Candidatus Nitrosocosmicus sp.]|nr:hypothetical protein [Candidatus Nitrosocosmicus sp.]
MDNIRSNQKQKLGKTRMGNKPVTKQQKNQRRPPASASSHFPNKHMAYTVKNDNPSKNIVEIKYYFLC